MPTSPSPGSFSVSYLIMLRNSLSPLAMSAKMALITYDGHNDTLTTHLQLGKKRAVSVPGK